MSYEKEFRLWNTGVKPHQIPDTRAIEVCRMFARADEELELFKDTIDAEANTQDELVKSLREETTYLRSCITTLTNDVSRWKDIADERGEVLTNLADAVIGCMKAR